MSKRIRDGVKNGLAALPMVRAAVVSGPREGVQRRKSWSM